MKGIRFFQTIQIKLNIIYVLLILVAMQVIGVYFVRTIETSFKTNFTESLNKQAYLLAEFVEPYLSENMEGKPEDGRKTYESLNDVVNNLFSIDRAEIQIIDSGGTVRVISTFQQERKELLNQKNTQNEVSQALQGIRDIEREIQIQGEPTKIVAQPVVAGSKVVGAVYIVASMKDLYTTLNRINKIFISGTLIALVLTGMLGVILSHTITNPIKEITRQATAVAEGSFNRPVEVKGFDEIGQLGHTFNYMTDRLKEALTTNEEEREKLSSILSSMSDGVMATDDVGQVILVNRRAKQILSLSDQDIVGKEISELLGMAKETVGKYVLGEEHETILHLQTSDEEEETTVHVVFTPIHRRGRGVTGTIAVLHDITEQVKMEASRREFVANVSHELRTPLTTIKSYLEALGDGAMEEPDLAKRFIGVTQNETERMIRLVHDLLHLSRLDSKQAVLRKTPTSIAEMLEEVADRFSFQLQQKQIRIHLQIEEQVGEVLLDRDQIDQVLDNLVSNAIKYTSEGGRIAIEARKQDDQSLEICVRDNGIGIPKKDLGYIFDRFYRVDKARSRNMGGTGLGLSIAREIVKAHGGTIALDSEFNHGTSVSFTIPGPAEGGAAG
jgi:two-component system, OmpR family, sensor histidine kinase VicK